MIIHVLILRFRQSRYSGYGSSHALSSPDRQHPNGRFANRALPHASQNQVAQSGPSMRNHYAQTGRSSLFDFEYRASRVAALHHQFVLGFGTDIFD
jgi:hypothetical protein